MTYLLLIINPVKYLTIWEHVIIILFVKLFFPNQKPSTHFISISPCRTSSRTKCLPSRAPSPHWRSPKGRTQRRSRPRCCQRRISEKCQTSRSRGPSPFRWCMALHSEEIMMTCLPRWMKKKPQPISSSSSRSQRASVTPTLRVRRKPW